MWWAAAAKQEGFHYAEGEGQSHCLMFRLRYALYSSPLRTSSPTVGLANEVARQAEGSQGPCDEASGCESAAGRALRTVLHVLRRKIGYFEFFLIDASIKSRRALRIPYVRVCA